MDIKIISGVIVFAIIALVIGLMIPGGESPPVQTFPWQIESTADGSIRVFGLVLGQSTLQEAEQQLRSTAKITLFDTPDKTQVVEAYFDKLALGGLSAQMVI
ncbi:hypothetical protein, partial [Kaarinaea lacus]